MDIDDLLTTLRAEMADMTACAESFERQAAVQRQEAALIGARIQGIEEARAALTSPEAERPILQVRFRKPRRNIRAMVRELSLVGGWTVTGIAGEIGCRVSQVEAALRAINGQGSAEPTPGNEPFEIQPNF